MGYQGKSPRTAGAVISTKGEKQPQRSTKSKPTSGRAKLPRNTKRDSGLLASADAHGSDADSRHIKASGKL